MFKANVILKEAASSDDDGQPSTYVEEAVLKIAKNETWTYVMLSMSSRYMEERGRTSSTDFSFLLAGFNVSEGELNGRLKAQNVARKLVIAQAALWAYVALGQTATALLSNV